VAFARRLHSCQEGCAASGCTVTRNAHTVTDELFANLKSFYSEGEIVELLCAIGLLNHFNRFYNVLHMEPTKPGKGDCAAEPDKVAW
jgi:hypothetical protein